VNVSGCRSFHSRVLALPSSTVVPLERPQPGCAELPFQPAPQQLERDPRGVDVSVPEGCLASTVGTAQDVPVALECDLLAHELGRATGRRAVERGSNAEHSVLASCRVIPPRAPWSLPARTCLRPLPTLHPSVPEAVQWRIFEALLQKLELFRGFVCDRRIFGRFLKSFKIVGAESLEFSTKSEFASAMRVSSPRNPTKESCMPFVKTHEFGGQPEQCKLLDSDLVQGGQREDNQVGGG